MKKLLKYSDDFLVIAGCVSLLYATIQLSLIAFWYLLGVMLITSGIVVAKGMNGGINDHS